MIKLKRGEAMKAVFACALLALRQLIQSGNVSGALEVINETLERIK